MTMGDRVKSRRQELGLTQAALAKRAGVTQSLIAGIERGTYESTRSLTSLAEALEVSPTWLASGKEGAFEPPVPHKLVLPADSGCEEAEAIPYWDARGSCGGGAINYEQLPAGHLLKERTFFTRYSLKPKDAIAIYADGDSMADFIVDGDIVIFDTSKTEARSGKIFLIQHPDGLRIKQLRREIDGTWVLESRNADKLRYPDERVPPDHAERLKIFGQFVYRQGG